MQNLEIEISSGEGGSYLVAARSDAAGDTRGTQTRFPFDEQMLARLLQAVELALMRSAATVRRLTPADEQPVQAFGRQLFEFLFPAEVREHLSAVRHQAAQEDTSIQVRLRILPPHLAALPWEFLYDPGRDDYLCLSTPLVRYLDVLEPRRPLAVTPPLRILGMVARPDELSTLKVDHEKRRLQEALTDLEHAGGVQLTWVAGQTWWDLQAALDLGAWHIFHFIGHGGFDQQTGEGILGLADEDGGVHRLAASDLSRMLGEHHSLRLAVLNSCETARSSISDVFSSTASVLMRRGIPAVVAMQYDISDDAAIAFARGLYTAVASRHPVDQAVTRARRAIKLARSSTLEWATPVLYLRSPHAKLFDLAGIPTTDAMPARPVAHAPHPPEPDRTHESSQATRPDPAALHDAKGPPPCAPRGPTGSELVQMHHDDEVMAVSFSPDGIRLATAGKDLTARFWEVDTGRQLARMQNDGWVSQLSFSPDGTRLATACKDNTARLWEASTGRQLARMQHDNWVTLLMFSPDGTQLATNAVTEETVWLWDAGTGHQLAQMKHGGLVFAISFSPDGTRLATGSDDNAARLWEVGTGRQLARMKNDGWVSTVSFSLDGTRLVTAGKGNAARLWEVSTGRQLAWMQHDDEVWVVAFSPDGTRLATGSNDNTARLWEVSTGRQLARMQHDDEVSVVAFSPDGTRLATGSNDNTARLWEVSTGRQLARMQHDSKVMAVAFSPDGTRLATRSKGNTARLWAA